MTQHVLTILIEDDDLPDGDEVVEEFLDLFEEFWVHAREFNAQRLGVHVTRFRSAGLAP